MATTGKFIEVDTAQLMAAATQIEGLAAEYKKQYDLLFSETSALSANWKDRANTAFVEQIEGFKDDLEKMRTLVESYVGFLRKSAKSYEDTINDAATRAKNLRNS